MPIPTGGLLKIRLLQNWGGQNIENVFYYWNAANNEPASFVALGADFNDIIVETLKLIVDDDLDFVSVVLSTVLGTLPDLPVTPSSSAGVLVGDDTASFYAMAFRLNRTTKETRNGAKRFGGMHEGQVEGNFVAASQTTLMNTFAPQMAIAIDSGSNLYDPVIFSPPNMSHEGNLVNLIDSVTALATLTTQRSRNGRLSRLTNSGLWGMV